MKHPVVRGIVGVLAGCFAATAFIMLIELVSGLIFPHPTAEQMADPAAMAAFIASMPISAFLMVLFAYLVGTVTGVWVAARVGRSRIPGIIVGVIVLCTAIVNLLRITHPTWFTITGIAVIAISVWVGLRMSAPRAQPA